MRKLITLGMIMLTGSLFAANFVYSTGQHVKTVGVKQNFMAAEVYFSTPQPEDIVFQFKLLKNDLPSDWSFSLCGYGTCYVGVPGSGEFRTITKEEMEEGKEVFFQLMASPKSLGSGKVQIYVYEKGNFSRGDTVTLEVHNVEKITGVEDVNISGLSVYPNPANGLVNINVPYNLDVLGISVLNMQGQIVWSDKSSIKSGTYSINVSDLKDGVYFVSMNTSTGVRSAKISVVH